jgi:hypothetical protein
LFVYSHQELSKMSTHVYRHDLTGKLETALRSSNAQYEETDILNRLGVRLMEPSSGVAPPENHFMFLIRLSISPGPPEVHSTLSHGFGFGSRSES